MVNKSTKVNPKDKRLARIIAVQAIYALQNQEITINALQDIHHNLQIEIP